MKTLKNLVKLEFAARLAGRFIRVIDGGPTKREAPKLLCSEAMAGFRDVEILFDAVNIWTIQIARHPDAQVMMSVQLHTIFSEIVNRDYDAIAAKMEVPEQEAFKKLVPDMVGISAAFNNAETVEFDPKNPLKPTKKTPVLLN